MSTANHIIPNHVAKKKVNDESYPPELVPIETSPSRSQYDTLPPLVPLDMLTDHKTLPNHLDETKTNAVGCCYGCGCNTGTQCDQCGTPVCSECIGCERHGLVCAAIHDEEFVGISLSAGDLSLVEKRGANLVAHDVASLTPEIIGKGEAETYGLNDVLSRGVSVYKVNTGQLSKTARISTRVVPVGTGAVEKEIKGDLYIYPAIVLINTKDVPSAEPLVRSHQRALRYLMKHKDVLVLAANKAVDAEIRKYTRKGRVPKKTTGVEVAKLS
jgi:hypothetical protein